MASPLFLMSPECLMAQLAHTFPEQKGKPTERPTARWVFQCVSGLRLLALSSLAQVVLNLDTHHRLEVLGECYIALYANSGLRGAE